MSFELKPLASTDLVLFPQHKKLQKLIEQIEQRKVDLAYWQQVQAQIQQQVSLKLLPIYRELHQIQFQQLQQLWDKVQHPEFTKLEQQSLDHQTAQLAQRLISARTLISDQTELVEKIQVFYAQLHKQPTQKKVISVAQDVDVQTISNSEAYADEWWCEEENYDKYQQQREQAKQKRLQEKREQAKKMAEQSLKMVYLKITSLIHPDREPDETKKLEKTELLQLVNEAYIAQDLFYLLKLKLQLEQDQSVSKKVLSTEQVKLYQLALEGQIEKLEQQIAEIIAGFYISTPVKSEADVYKVIDANVKSLKQQSKWETERLKYMAKVDGVKMLIAHGVL